MASRKLVQRTNAWLIRFDFFYIYSWVNGLCFGYFQIFPERSPFDLKITLTLTPFPYVRRLLDLRGRPISNIAYASFHYIGKVAYSIIYRVLKNSCDNSFQVAEH